MRYTFSDDEEDSDDFPSRKSTRNSGISTPAEPAGPTVTASGRQVKSRHGGMYGETMLMDQRKELENERAAAVNAHDSTPDPDTASGRPQRPTRPSRATRAPRRIDDSSEDMNGAESDDKEASGNDWSGRDDNDDDDNEPDDEDDDDDEDEDEEMKVRDSEMEDAPPPTTEQESLVVQLRYKKGAGHSPPPMQPARPNSSISHAETAVAAAADCIAVDPGPPLTQQRAHPVDPHGASASNVNVKDTTARVNGSGSAAPKLEGGRVQTPSLLRNNVTVRVMSFQ
jgi:hypothetical protein